MIYILLSVICSVFVGVLFKWSNKFNFNMNHVITYNYISAVILCFFIYDPQLTSVIVNAPWPIYGLLALIMPSLFLILAGSVKKNGLAKTDIAQRLSLIIPLIAAFFVFNEHINIIKGIGISLALCSIVLILNKTYTNNVQVNQKYWYYLLLVFLGFGTVDILFKQVALFKEVNYTTSLFLVFCLALTVSVIYNIYKFIVSKHALQIKDLVFGLILGIFNFGNILFYLKAHQANSNQPSIVFAGMNLGVIILGTFIGVYFFKEKLSVKNYLGLALAIIAVVLITISQFYVI